MKGGPMKRLRLNLVWLILISLSLVPCLEAPAMAATIAAGVSGGYYHSLGLLKPFDGKVSAWGLKTNGQCTVPAGLGAVAAVAAGGYHSLARRADGTVAAWGDNYYGQCTVPSNLNNVVAIAAGGEHSLALKADGTMVAWGRNNFGQCYQNIVSSIYLLLDN